MPRQEKAVIVVTVTHALVTASFHDQWMILQMHFCCLKSVILVASTASKILTATDKGLVEKNSMSVYISLVIIALFHQMLIEKSC